LPVLEILVAGYIIATVVTAPTLERVAILGLIKTFLSISIEVEIEGKFPWQKTKIEAIKESN
jgi:uncharacterized membrane protein